METKSLQKHPIRKLLKACLGLSDEQLCNELDVRGHDVPPDMLAAMLNGVEPMPEPIEKALKHVGAVHLFHAEYVLSPARVEQLVEPWYQMQERSPTVNCRPAFERFTDFLDDL
jgi:hypothetical protein